VDYKLDFPFLGGGGPTSETETNISYPNLKANRWGTGEIPQTSFSHFSTHSFPGEKSKKKTSGKSCTVNLVPAPIAIDHWAKEE
jgi:hypothetical protein